MYEKYQKDGYGNGHAAAFEQNDPPGHAEDADMESAGYTEGHDEISGFSDEALSEDAETDPADTETEAVSEAYSGSDIETVLDPDTETEPEETETEPESETETESEARTESETETESEARTESETETESETGTESEIGTESETGMESETGTGSETGTEPETLFVLLSDGTAPSADQQLVHISFQLNTIIFLLLFVWAERKLKYIFKNFSARKYKD